MDEVGSSAPLRFGVIHHGRRLRAWQVRCLHDLETSGVARLTVVVTAGLAGRTAGIPRIGMRSWPFLAYRRFVTRSAARRGIDAREIFRTVPSVRLGSSRDATDRDGVDALREFELDFMLDFAHAPLPDGLLSLPRHGVWAFRHGIRGRPSGFREFLEHDEVTVASLIRRSVDPDAAVVLREGVFAIRKASYRATLDAMQFGSAAWPRLVCVDLLNGRAERAPDAARPGRRPDRRYPAPHEVARLGLRLLGNRVRQASGSFFRRRTWNVGIVDAPIHTFLTPGFRPRVRFLDLPLKRHYFADPFGVVDGNGTTVLCEAFDYGSWRGSIVAVRVDRTGVASRPVEVLADGSHMSYPFLMEEAGTRYCIPERREAREIALYAAIEFPGKWTRVAKLLDGVEAVDATLFRHGGLWWLAYTDSALGLSDNLCLAYADALRGPWRRHAANPVKRDVRSSRPAGTPFVHDGMLYRPAQDASRTYGGRVVINRVTALSPVAFAEEVAAVVEPDPAGPFPSALHTLSAAGPVTLVDGRRDAPSAPRVGAALGTLRRSWQRRRIVAAVAPGR